eukprot:222496-Pyramimonas_sp.AAC.1
MADELAMHHHGHDAAKEWTTMHALQKFGGKKRKSAAAGLPIRFDKAGELITTRGHLSSALTVHFAEIEKGVLLSWDELRARYNNEQLDILDHA